METEDEKANSGPNAQVVAYASGGEGMETAAPIEPMSARTSPNLGEAGNTAQSTSDNMEIEEMVPSDTAPISPQQHQEAKEPLATIPDSEGSLMSNGSENDSGMSMEKRQVLALLQPPSTRTSDPSPAAQPPPTLFDRLGPLTTTSNLPRQHEAISSEIEPIPTRRPRQQSAPGAFPVTPAIPLQALDLEEPSPRPLDELAMALDPPQDDQLVVAPNAFLVPSTRDEELRDQVRQEILQQAVQAEVAKPPPNSHWKWIGLAIGVVILLIVLSVGLAVGLTRQSSSSSSSPDIPTKNQTQPTSNFPLMSEFDQLMEFFSRISYNESVPTNASKALAMAEFQDGLTTLERVQKRGSVKCASFYNSHGFSVFNETTQTREGMNVEHCRAIALVALGDPDLYEIVLGFGTRNRFKALYYHFADVLTSTTTHNMGRDVFEPSAQFDYTNQALIKTAVGSGFSFSVPFVYTGLGFGGIPEFVDCADRLDAFTGICRQLKICVGSGTSHVQILEQVAASASTVVRAFLVDNMVNGSCNVIAKDTVGLTRPRIVAEGYEGDYKVGKRLLSREPLVLATRDNDPEWTKLVNSVVQLQYTAEAQNLTQSSARELRFWEDDRGASGYTDDLYERMLRIVAEFGNYGELYAKTIGNFVPREFPNRIHTAPFNTGLMYYYPFGNLETPGPSPISGQTLHHILERGHLVCGVVPKPGFAEYNATSDSWSGLDVEFCKAVNAAIHMGATHTVEYITLASSESDSSSFLQSGKVDLVAGERMTLEKDLLGNMTLSVPYYYDNRGNAFGFATRSDDPQFSDFVFWIVIALIYAETEGITQEALRNDFSLVPTVNLFGEQLKPMFYDCIASVGNYGEIYNRSLESLIPRSGGNLLNKDLDAPQQFALPLS